MTDGKASGFRLEKIYSLDIHAKSSIDTKREKKKSVAAIITEGAIYYKYTWRNQNSNTPLYIYNMLYVPNWSVFAATEMPRRINIYCRVDMSTEIFINLAQDQHEV
jgi:hypothetical protein